MYRCQDPNHVDPPDTPERDKRLIGKGIQSAKKVIKVRQRAHGKGKEIEREIVVCPTCAERDGEAIIAEIAGVTTNA